MKILGICGSPRIGGNTHILLKEVLRGAKDNGAECKEIILNRLNFSPCQECANVRKDGVCKVQDDMHIVYREVARADTVIVASPIFFGSISAQTKMMIDRYQCFWLTKYIYKTCKTMKKKKLGVFISVESSMKQDFFENAKSIIKNFFATIGASYTEELFCPGIEKKGDVLKKTKCLKRAYEIGRKVGTRTGLKS